MTPKGTDGGRVAGDPGKVLKTDERLYDMNMHNHESYLKLKEWYRDGKVPVHRSG